MPPKDVRKSVGQASTMTDLRSQRALRQGMLKVHGPMYELKDLFMEDLGHSFPTHPFWLPYLLSPKHTANKWQRQDSNPNCPSLESLLPTAILKHLQGSRPRRLGGRKPLDEMRMRMRMRMGAAGLRREMKILDVVGDGVTIRAPGGDVE